MSHASGISTRLEICDTNGDKFWEVTVEGPSTTIRQGLIGAECAAEDKVHNDEPSAQVFATSQAAAKRELGYFDSVQLSGRTVPDGPFLYLHDDKDEPVDENERDFVEIPSSVDHLLAGVALNRVDEVEEFLARHGNDISSHRLLCALYAAMMCGHDEIASELSKYVAAAKTTHGDPGVEPVTYLCWTLLCVGWCASSGMRPSPDDLRVEKSTMKFQLQHFDWIHQEQEWRFQDLGDCCKWSDDEYVNEQREIQYREVINRHYDDYCATVVDVRHLRPIAQAGNNGDSRTGGQSYNKEFDLWDCAGLVEKDEKDEDNYKECHFDLAKYYKGVVDSAFGDDVRRMPNDAIYTGWHEWWLAECATRPTNESRAVLLAEGPAGCTVSTLLGIINTLPPCVPTAILRQHVSKFALEAFNRKYQENPKRANWLLSEPHWQITNPGDYNRLARDLMQSQSSKWITSSCDIRASTIVMAGLDVFVRPSEQIQAESFDERVSAMVRLTDWPARSPLTPSHVRNTRSHDGRSGNINRGLVFVSDCDPRSFDLTDIPPTGLLPMHTLIAHRVKAEFGDNWRSGKIEG
jgi:predicted DNA-binding WGR domain protein